MECRVQVFKSESGFELFEMRDVIFLEYITRNINPSENDKIIIEGGQMFK